MVGRIFFCEVGETLVVQSSCESPTPGSVPSWVGLAFEQPALVESVRAQSREGGTG